MNMNVLAVIEKYNLAVVEKNGLYILEYKNGSVSNGRDFSISFKSVNSYTEVVVCRIKGSIWSWDGYNDERDSSFDISVSLDKLDKTIEMILSI